MSDDQGQITDAELTAYLDGEADAALTARIDAGLAVDTALAQRLEALAGAGNAIKAAFDLDGLDPPSFPSAGLQPEPRRLSTALIPLAIAASFAIGMVVMSLLRPAPTWVDTIASYHALYVTETLSGADQPPQASDAVLQSAQEMLGVDLRPATSLPGLTFKRAQILSINGQPLLQMAYLDEGGLPFAFCVTLPGDADRDDLQRMSHDVATNSWVTDGVGYVLVGGGDIARVSDLSAVLQRQL
ncbi:hypothetical protein SLH49_03850 [Cognatiyoonia sp. IB215446]|uniref:anti-sigma factor family protein n=1 Tax=Cognatiyoonia sp. IB215446 TaxID=3097355 RepID=UPI002A0C756D|nr:hypothetical protein [Cognatiyoonia sp. IB215446]MDX8347112.1 hypothetical protein [Cognatiyoonia sp. IB215446]